MTHFCVENELQVQNVSKCLFLKGKIIKKTPNCVGLSDSGCYNGPVKKKAINSNENDFQIQNHPEVPHRCFARGY